ncbi:MAG: DNA polymerase III subunit gamma/tau [Parachlamydiales bacterium]|nr:DNA polymerase III subunit gamma/tau [Parachlamydiales bacterium]
MSLKYQILARKYRPQTFKEVIGQESIVKTIKNSIKKSRVAHAYLFSGTRGTGKTTLARLFAKALNCKNLTNDFDPCNECKSCLEITASRSLDVIEIDGASNRGIDDIRQINDTIGYASSNTYKIYIIDEVHMLTKEAFNALLKTLEEPPENIKFFFATTEPHKVLPTIISRCQRFELKRITHGLIVEKLKDISDDQKKQIDEDALHLIAHFSEGSLRDAESLLDQLFCYSDEKITLDYVNNALGFIDKDYFFELDKNIYESNLKFAFEFTQKITSSGKDISYVVKELLMHFRNLLSLKLDESSLDYLSETIRKKYISQQSLYTNEMLFYILDEITKASIFYKNSFNSIHLETLILKIIKSKNLVSIDTLIKRLVKLEKDLQGSAPSIKNEVKEEAKEFFPPPSQKNEPLKIKEENKQVFSEKTDNSYEKIDFSISDSSSTDNNAAVKDNIKVEEKIIDSINSKNTEEEKEIDSPSLKKNETILKDQSHFDTLIRFTQIELEGMQKN